MDSYDIWKTTSPEPKESKCKCYVCKEELLPDDEYFEIEGDIYCEICAERWLEGQKNWVTEDMAYGERRYG